MLWGFGKYYDSEETGDVSEETLGFAGDRDVYGNIPPMVSLPPDNSYKWKEVRGELDEAAYITFANNEANKNSYQAHQTTLTHGVSDRKLPRMI